METGTIHGATTTDSTLSATTVNNTGKSSAAITVGKYGGAIVNIAATFPNPATDDLTVEVRTSIDGTTFQTAANRSWTITRSAGATLYQNFVVSPFEPVLCPDGTNYIDPCYAFKVLLKSSGATDTPTVTLKYRKFREGDVA